jgi:hypothetical protein
MKIYLIKTPEYNQDAFREVADLLKTIDGPMQFIPSLYEFEKSEFYFLRYSLFPHHNFSYPSNDNAIKFDPNKIHPLSWRELFSLCKYYRNHFSIEADSFVVLLTQRKNSLNWFSALDGSNNIFVHTAEWDLYTNVNSKYPIAYEVVQNIVQSLMDIDMSNIPNAYCHEPLRGCMNDFCYNKRQVVIKLQTANICGDCIERIRSKNIDNKLIIQVNALFNKIRNEFIFQMSAASNPVAEPEIENPPINPIPLVVERDGRLILPTLNLEIEMTPLFKALYLFFLFNPEGVTLSSLCDYNDEIRNIYMRLRPGVAPEDAISRIEKLTYPNGDGFNTPKSHINKIINNLLPELVEFYQISGTRGGAYSIQLPRRLIDIRF